MNIGSVRKPVLSLCVLMVLGSTANLSVSSDLAASTVDIRAWPRMSSSDFGCYMEKTFGHRDRHFNCALKHYQNHGDPCKNTKAYYEGPVFPESSFVKIHPLAKSVALDWEHGELQMVDISLAGKFSDQEVRAAFKLPANNTSLPNVMDISIQDTGNNTTDLILTGFDHIGAGDADCPA